MIMVFGVMSEGRASREGEGEAEAAEEAEEAEEADEAEEAGEVDDDTPSRTAIVVAVRGGGDRQ